MLHKCLLEGGIYHWFDNVKLSSLLIIWGIKIIAVIYHWGNNLFVVDFSNQPGEEFLGKNNKIKFCEKISSLTSQ